MKPNRIPNWSITGVCTEARELKNKEGKTWAYLVKLMALGGMYELKTKDEQMFKTFGEGIEYETTGTFDHFNGNIQFQLKQVKALA
jgi:hypothetical protein